MGSSDRRTLPTRIHPADRERVVSPPITATLHLEGARSIRSPVVNGDRLPRRPNLIPSRVDGCNLNKVRAIRNRARIELNPRPRPTRARHRIGEVTRIRLRSDNSTINVNPTLPNPGIVRSIKRDKPRATNKATTNKRTPDVRDGRRTRIGQSDSRGVKGRPDLVECAPVAARRCSAGRTAAEPDGKPSRRQTAYRSLRQRAVPGLPTGAAEIGRGDLATVEDLALGCPDKHLPIVVGVLAQEA